MKQNGNMVFERKWRHVCWIDRSLYKRSCSILSYLFTFSIQIQPRSTIFFFFFCWLLTLNLFLTIYIWPRTLWLWDTGQPQYMTSTLEKRTISNTDLGRSWTHNYSEWLDWEEEWISIQIALQKISELI